MKSTLYISSALLISCVCAEAAHAQKDLSNPGGVLSIFNSPPRYKPTTQDEKRSLELQLALKDVLAKARAAVNAGDIKEAVPLFNQAKRLEADSMLVVHSAPNPEPIEEESLIAQRRYRDAITLFERPQGSVTDQAWLTILYWRVADKPRARMAFHKAFYKSGRLNFPDKSGLGRFLALNGETDAAIQAAALMYVGAHINGDLVSRVHDQLELLKEADAFVPNDPYITYSIGKAYYEVQQFREALRYLRIAEPGLAKVYLEDSDCSSARYSCQLHLANESGGRG